MNTFWVLAIPSDTKSFVLAGYYTRHSMQRMQVELERFRKTFEEYPISLAQMKKMRTSGIAIAPYDGYGSRLAYFRLDPKSYLLKSWGRDQKSQTALGEIDPTVLKIPEVQIEPTKFQKFIGPTFYRADLLKESTSPNEKWQATIYVDRVLGHRRLVVTNLEQRQRILLAPQELVEEALWLEDNRHLILTAQDFESGSSELYLWDLSAPHPTKVSLQNAGSKLPASKQKERGFYVSLAGLADDPDEFYLFYQPIDAEFLDPARFFSASSLYVYNIKNKALRTADFSQDQHSLFECSQTETPWCSLPKAGLVENTLVTWQEFLDQRSDEPFSCHALWMLIALYNDSLKILYYEDTKAFRVLKAYAIEMALALKQQSFAPAHLRSSAEFFVNQLAEGPLGDLQVSQLKLHE